MLTLASPKVFVRDGYAFGFAGHFRFSQVVQHVFIPPKYRGQDPAEFLARDFAEVLRATCKAVGYSKSKEGRDEGGHALIGFQGRLFIMQDEFDVIETVDGIAAIGCGYPYAVAALKALDGLPDVQRLGLGLSPEQKVDLALKVAEYYSGGVRAPFHIVTLEGKTHVRGSRGANRAKHSEHPSGNRKRPARKARSRAKGGS